MEEALLIKLKKENFKRWYNKNFNLSMKKDTKNMYGLLETAFLNGFDSALIFKESDVFTRK